MGKYYKFPRRYYNRNKVRKPLKPRHIFNLLLLCLIFYLLCSWLFAGVYRCGSDSMSPWCNADDKLVAVRTFTPPLTVEMWFCQFLLSITLHLFGFGQ